MGSKSRMSAFAVVGACVATAVIAVAAAQAGREATPEPFRFGVIAGFNTTASNQPEFLAGAQAAAAALNRQGGIGGRRIEIIPCSNQASAAVATQCARQLVSQRVDNVIQAQSIGAGAEIVLRTAGVPEIGTFLVAPTDYRNPLSFPVVPGTLEEVIGAALHYLKDKNIKRWVALGQDAASARNNFNVVRSMVTRRGRQWVGQLLFPAGTTDITSYVQRVKDMDPDIVYLSNSAASVIQYNQIAATLGVRVPTMHIGYTVGEAEAAVAPDKGARLVIGAGLPLTPRRTSGGCRCGWRTCAPPDSTTIPRISRSARSRAGSPSAESRSSREGSSDR